MTSRASTESAAGAAAADQRYRRLFELLPDGVLVTDTVGLIVDLNPIAAALLGADPIGKPLDEAIPPERRADFRERLADIVAGANASSWELDFRPPHSRAFTASVNVASIPPVARDMPGLLWSIRDITARRHAEELQFTAPVLAVLNEPLDSRDAIRAVLTHVKRFMDVEAVGIRLADRDDFPYYQVNGFPDEFVQIENSLCCRDENGDALRDADGHPVMDCMCGNVLQGRVDPALPFFTEWGSFWTNHTTQLLASTTQAARQARTRGHCNAAGYESVALIPLRVGDTVLGLLQLNDHRRGCFTAERVEFLEHIGTAIAGALVRKQSEEALRASEARARFLAEALEHASVPFASRDVTGRLIFFNAAYCNLLGYTEEELQQLETINVLTPPDWQDPAAERRSEVLRTGAPIRYEKEYVRKDGARIPVELFVHPMVDADGKTVGWQSFITDLTPRRRAEEAQRLATVGTLGAGVAHEFNNLLAAISGRAELARDMGSQENYDKLIATALSITQHGSQITRGLLSFARRVEPRLACVPIEESIAAALGIVEQECRSREVQVVWQNSATVTLVQADPRQLQQVFVNLFVNACHAMAQGGTLTVAVRGGSAQEDEDEVVVTVADTGIGIRPADVRRVFEPFYTTKGVFGSGDIPGTGLGLSVSRGIIETHGGRISLTSQLGAGTIFEVRLPAVAAADDAEAADPAPPPAADAPQSAGKRILVADDQAENLDNVAGALGNAGFAVSTAGAADEVIAILQEQPVDLVVSDLMMPGGGGERVLEFVRTLPIPPPVLLLTGRLERDLERKLKDAGAVACLRKPVRLGKLVAAVTHHLGEAQPPAD